jgi:hypothetical protein
MEKYLKKGVKPQPANLNLIVSKGKQTSKCKSASKVHGGFDNDHYTMNTILRKILQGKPKKLFEAGYMDD